MKKTQNNKIANTFDWFNERGGVKRVGVEDIKALTDAQCDNLNCGDEVIKGDETKQHGYIVAYKKANEMSLVYCDHENVEEVYYEKGANGWEWIQTDITPISELDPTEIEELETLLEMTGNAGKVPVVNEDEDGYDFKDISSGCVVQVSTDGGETYGSGIALEEFIGKCENGDYAESVGAIARITKLINGQTMRIRLIGVNHDVLANTDLGELEPNGTKAKTTWQFLDMPFQKVNLGLPYDAQDFDSVANFVAGDDYYAYPSNKHGYTSAVGLLNAMQEIFNSLPTVLQQAIKTVRKDCFIPRISHNDDISDVQDNSTKDYIEAETDRYGSCISAKLFCLSASEMGMTHATGSGDDQFAYDVEITVDEEQVSVNLEGKKYAFFDETPQDNQSESARNKRICFYNGSAWYYWLRSPLLLFSSYWGICYSDGNVDRDSTSNDRGVAPAFAI